MRSATLFILVKRIYLISRKEKTKQIQFKTNICVKIIQIKKKNNYSHYNSDNDCVQRFRCVKHTITENAIGVIIIKKSGTTPHNYLNLYRHLSIFSPAQGRVTSFYTHGFRSDKVGVIFFVAVRVRVGVTSTFYCGSGQGCFRIGFSLLRVWFGFTRLLKKMSTIFSQI